MSLDVRPSRPAEAECGNTGALRMHTGCLRPIAASYSSAVDEKWEWGPKDVSHIRPSQVAQPQNSGKIQRVMRQTPSGNR